MHVFLWQQPGIWQIHDSTDSLQAPRSGSVRTKHSSGSSQESSSRFPKLEDCAHFHYDFVDFGFLQVCFQFNRKAIDDY